MAHNTGVLPLSKGRELQINKLKQGGKAMRETQTMHLQQISKHPTERRKDKVSQIKETTMMEDTSHPKDI
jgi:hypothetical protein